MRMAKNSTTPTGETTMGLFSRNKDDRDDYGAALAGYRHDPDVVRAEKRLADARAKLSTREVHGEQAKYRKATTGR
jgi:hypothetical protein